MYSAYFSGIEEPLDAFAIKYVRVEQLFLYCTHVAFRCYSENPQCEGINTINYYNCTFVVPVEMKCGRV